MPLPASRPRRWIGALAPLCLLAGIQPVGAQTTLTKWDVEGHVGRGLASISTGGDARLPAAGSFTTATGRPTLRVSSWYFGDGARLLNEVLAGLALPGSVPPLDPLLASSVGDRSGMTFGIRFGRAVSHRFRAELSVDYIRRSAGFDDDVRAAIDASRAGFETRWRRLLSSVGSLATVNAASNATTDGGGSQLLAIGALNINLLSPVISDLLPLMRRFVPFVTVGAGVLSYAGDPLHITIDGLYQFSLPNVVHVSEADSVSGAVLHS